MLLKAPFARFVEAALVSVMMRVIIENQFHLELLQRIFEETAVNQYTRTLPFSTVAEVMGEVVFNVNPPLNAALVERADLGQSGSSIVDLGGFQRLLTEFSSDAVGLVLGLEMSRLARS